MTYILLPAIVAGMLGYMLWSTVFRLRHDRVKSERQRSRGRFAFRRPRERIRFLLNRAFHVPDEKQEWEAALVSSLTKTPAAQEETPRPE